MKLRLEDDSMSCGKVEPCPKIWGIEGDDEWVFVQGKRLTAEESDLFAAVPPDEVVTKYPRASMRTWAAD